MNFYEMWKILENKPTRIVGNTDPLTMSKTWDRLSPQNPAQNLVHLGEIWNLTRLLSNNEINQIWRAIFENKTAPGVQVYQRPLKEMVKIPNIAGTVTGEISPEPKFYCFPEKTEETIVSQVMIAPPPAIYKNEDRALLASIIIHELRHAMDFHEFKNTSGIDYIQNKQDHYEINTEAYARNIFEARAHADQIKNLMAALGSPERTKKVLKESILARGIIPQIQQSMIELVDLLCGTQETFEPPAIIIKDENKIDKIVELLQTIVESFKFSRFVKTPQ